MRKELYKAIKEAVMSTGMVKHVDLWNHNVEFIEQEEAWERPAVFVEFGPIRWHALVNGVEYRAEPEVRLHIVSDWPGGASVYEDGTLALFDLPDEIHRRLACLEGETFTCLDLQESVTNHNHEELVEEVEVYSYVAMKRLNG